MPSLAVDPTGATADDVAQAAEVVIGELDQLRAVADERYRAQIDGVGDQLEDVRRTLGSLQSDADYSTWEPLVDSTFEDLAIAQARLRRVMDPACQDRRSDEQRGRPGRRGDLMDGVLIAIQALVVIGAIVMGTRSSGVGLGIWGGVGVMVLVFVFRLEPGSAPVDAMLIIIAVVVTAGLMQVSGGIDWMVSVAAKAIANHPKQITLIAPLMSFLFSVGAGTSNVLYPLMPVIYDVSYRNGIRPSRPLSLSVVSTGVALACSPVSAAMAAMVTLTEVDPYNFDLISILAVAIPAALIGIVVSSFVVRRLGAELEDDPEFQARIAAGTLQPPGSGEQVEVDGDQAGTQRGVDLPRLGRPDRRVRTLPRPAPADRRRRWFGSHLDDRHDPAADVHRCGPR